MKAASLFPSLLALLLSPFASGEIDSNALLEELSAAEALWSANGPSSYDFELERSCFCVEDYRGPYAIGVRDGAVASVSFTATDLANKAVSADLASEIPTVEGLFGIVEKAIERNPARMNVEYDVALGYPKRIHIDRVREIKTMT